MLQIAIQLLTTQLLALLLFKLLLLLLQLLLLALLLLPLFPLLLALPLLVRLQRRQWPFAVLGLLLLTTQLLALLLNLALFFLLLAPLLPRGTTPRRSSLLSKRCPSFGDNIGNRQPLFVNGTQSWL